MVRGRSLVAAVWMGSDGYIPLMKFCHQRTCVERDQSLGFFNYCWCLVSLKHFKIKGNNKSESSV